MRQLAGRGLRRLIRSAGLARLGMAVLAGLTFSVARAQPANDNFANAIDLTYYGDSGSTTGSNVGATIEPVEQAIDIFSVYASVWYSWTAPTNETMEFDATGSVFGTNLTMVQIFTNSGSGISTLQWVGYSYYGHLSGSFLDYTNGFQAVAGQTYYIAVAGYYYPSATGSIQLNWSPVKPVGPPPNDNFASATVLTGVWGSTNVDNTLGTAEAGEPSHAGFAANGSVWYQWTAPQDGEVALDTIGSVGLDTVLAVYTGSSLSSLNQVAANDDLFPVNSTLAMYNYSTAFASGSVVSGGVVSSSGGVTLFSYYQDYYGPSGLRFNAKAGVTYNIAVDTKSSTSSRGVIVLNWAYKSSGVFRWATEDVDPYASFPISSSYNIAYMPLYKTSDYESRSPSGLNNSSLSVVSTYYNYNAPGVLVTVTRTAGSSGRVLVDYTTVDGDNLPSPYAISPYDAPAHGGATETTEINFFVDTNGVPISSPSTNLFSSSVGNYTPISGTLVFDDFEMSKTLLITVNPNSSILGYGSNPLYITNVYRATTNGYVFVTNNSPTLVSTANTTQNTEFGLVLSNPRLDPYESSFVSPPRVDPSFNAALVEILNSGADPYGPNSVRQVRTNGYSDPPTNTIPILVTNIVTALHPTNAVFNFQKANYRVPADVNGTNSPWAQVTLWVERFGTNGSQQTINYRVNNFLGEDADADEEYNAFFPLQPGSDYAVPTPPTNNVFRGRNSDFNMTQGTLNFPNNGNG